MSIPNLDMAWLEVGAEVSVIFGCGVDERVEDTTVERFAGRDVVTASGVRFRIANTGSYYGPALRHKPRSGLNKDCRFLVQRSNERAVKARRAQAAG